MEPPNGALEIYLTLFISLLWRQAHSSPRHGELEMEWKLEKKRRRSLRGCQPSSLAASNYDAH